MRHRPAAAISRLLPCLWLLALAVMVPAAKLDPEAEEFYNQARYFMTNDEQKTFRNLVTPEARREFIAAFWEIRDPDPDTEENEFRTELEERFTFVSKYLREANRPGWDTARGMVYMVLGPPDLENASQTSSTLSASQANPMPNSVIWPYLELDIEVWFIDRQGYGVFELDMFNTSPRLLNLLEAGKTRFIREKGQGAEDRFLEFKARIDAASDKVHIAIATKDLRYDIDSQGGYTARIHLAINLYMADGSIVMHKDDRRIALAPATLEKGWLEMTWTIPLPKGKSKVDLLVLDQVAGKANRQFISVKKR